MRKNKMMRTAAVLLVAVLLTTCAISGTFAKYTSTGTASDSARVAYWGWGSQSVKFDLFDGAYDNVKSGDNDNVIAPGTTKTMSLTIESESGAKAPEVAYEITFALSLSEGTKTDGVLSKLVWNLNGTQVGTNGTWNELLTAIANEKWSYGAGELPGGDSDTNTLSISWEWPYDSDDTTDTALGNAENLETIEIIVTYTATQVN